MSTVNCQLSTVPHQKIAFITGLFAPTGSSSRHARSSRSHAILRSKASSALPGRPLLVECAQPRQAQRALQGAGEIIAMAQIGASLRVLSAVEDARERILRRLTAQGIEARVTPTEANLEDVFVTVTHRPLQRAGTTP